MAGRRIPWVWVVVVAIGLSLIIIPSVRGRIGRLTLTILQPVVHLGQGISDHWPFTNTGRSQHQADLRQQIEDLTTKLYQANLQLETIQAAVKLSDFSRSTQQTLVTANVITASLDPGIQSIVIDRGSNDRIAIGQIVVADRGAAVGKVVAVHQNQSTVLLMTDRQSVFAARVQNQQQSSGVIRGERGLALQMEFIPKNDALKTSDTVVTSGTETHIPPDILVGSIASISSRPGDLFQQAVVTPAAPMERLRVVAVIIK